MKFIVTFLFALLVGTLGYTWGPERLKCAEEQKLNKNIIEDLDNPWDLPTAEDNEVLNNYLECTWRKQGALNNNNEIDWDKVVDIMINKDLTDALIDIMKDVIDHCHKQNIHGDSPGQTCAMVQNCIGAEIRKTTIKHVP